MANEFKVKNGVLTPVVSNVANSDVAISASGTGKLKLNGLNWPGSDGSSNYVLKTDGAGNLSWVAQTGGGGTVTGDGGASVTIDTFTGTGSQTAFVLSVIPNSINYTTVAIDGVLQRRTNAYTLVGATISFSEAPYSGAAIEVATILSTTTASLYIDGGSVTTVFTETDILLDGGSP